MLKKKNRSNYFFFLCLISVFLWGCSEEEKVGNKKILKKTPIEVVQKQDIKKQNKVVDIKEVEKDTFAFVSQQHFVDSLFQVNGRKQEYEYKEIGTQIFIGNIFTKNQKHALLRYQNTDTTSLLTVLKNRKEKWDTVFHSTIEFQHTFGDFSQNEESVQFQDINFDGIQDVLIRKEILPMGSIALYEAFVYQNNQLKEVQEFEKIGTPNFDENTKKIYTQFISGSQLSFSISKIEKDQLIELQNVQIIPEYKNDSTVEVIINGNKGEWMTWEEAKKHIPAYYQEGYEDM